MFSLRHGCHTSPHAQLLTSCSLSRSLAMCKISSVLGLHAPCQRLEANLHDLFPAALSLSFLCSSEKVRTLLPQFLLSHRRSWKKVYEEQRATSVKRLCKGLYNKDIAHSMMDLSCLKKYLSVFINCKSRATALKWATTWVLALCQPVPLTVHLYPRKLISFVLILYETQSNRGSRKQIFIF